MKIVVWLWNEFVRHWRQDMMQGVLLSASIYGFDTFRYGFKPSHPIMHLGVSAVIFYIMVFVMVGFFGGSWMRYCDQGPLGRYSRKCVADIQAQRTNR